VNTLTVLYDDGCPFCRRCQRHLDGQAQLVPLRLVPMHSPAARSLFAAWGGRIPGDGRELVVVSDDGSYWVGSDAFLVCLWALERHHGVATALSGPLLRPFAGLFFDWVSEERGLLSSISRATPFWGGGEECEGGHCGTAPAAGAYR